MYIFASESTDRLVELQQRLSDRLRVVVVAGDEHFYRYALANTPFCAVPHHYHHIRVSNIACEHVELKVFCLLWFSGITEEMLDVRGDHRHYEGEAG